jgi:hypothetical protein
MFLSVYRRPERVGEIVMKKDAFIRFRPAMERLEAREVLSGMVTVQTDTSDSDNDGKVDSLTVLTREFDNLGNLISEVFAVDNNADGVVESSRSYTAEYDRLSNLTREVYAP